jgi:hypothetical protein
VQRTPGPGGTRADQIPPSLEGRPKERRHEVRVYAGKVTDVRYDRFGEFEGFTLRLKDGGERFFRGREHAVEDLVRTAWLERFVILVYVDRDADDWPETIILRRAPRR